MFSLAELQNSKGLLKRRAAAPEPAPKVTRGTWGSPVVPPDQSDVQTHNPLPAISLETLASAKVGLHRIPSLRSSSIEIIPSASLQVSSTDDAVLPAFIRRKELFEKHTNHSSSPLPTTAAVRVGSGDGETIFTVDIKTLRSSPRFRDELRETACLVELSLPDHSPQTFQLFLDYCQKHNHPVKYQPGQYSTDPWKTTSAAAWVLAVELRARMFEKYALSQFIQNCAIIVKGPWKYIEERAVSGSPLWRFSRHWIAWNTWLSTSNWWCHEYVGLEAADLAASVKPETRDPRVFDIDHWYTICGYDFNALCVHDPIHREQQHQRQARMSRPPPAEWGAEQELRARYRT